MEDNKEIMEVESNEVETNEKVQKEEVTISSDVEEIALEAESKGKSRKNRENKGRNRRRNDDKEEAPQSEWQERVIQIRRVTKVVKGGKKLSFRAIVIVGNQKGQVGVGAKASEVIIAIQKAVADGRKNLISVPIYKTTIPHPITGRSGAGSVMLRPASEGTGVIAGGAVRAVLELAGIENILSKSLGSKSPLNAANATLDALKSLRLFSDAAKTRGLSVMEMLS